MPTIVLKYQLQILFDNIKITENKMTLGGNKGGK
jgi:hypothetical protein